MSTKFYRILVLFITLFLLSGCSLSKKGYSLGAFCERMNELCEDYQLTPDGFIYNERKNSLTKYYSFNEKEIMLSFLYNNKNELQTLHIVFDNLTKNDTTEINFIKNSIYAFIDNTTEADNLLAEADFENAIFIKNINTKKTKIGNTEMLIDVTEIGTVISVVQNIP